MRSNTVKKYASYAGSAICLTAPTAAVFIVNRDKYFATAESTVNLTAGAMLALIIIIIFLVGKSNVLKGIKGLTIGLILIYFLHSVIEDMLLIYASFYAGYTGHYFIFAPLSKKYTQIGEEFKNKDIGDMITKQKAKEEEKAEAKRQKKLGSV